MTDRTSWAGALHASALLLAVSVVMTGCTLTESDASSRTDRVLQGFPGWELTDFQTGVLEDGVVSQAEYDEAFSLWVACVEGRGLHVEMVRDSLGLYTQSFSYPKDLTPREVEALRDASDECEDGTFPLVDAVYRDQVLNPQSLDWIDGVVACLVDEGTVASDFDRDDYLRGDLPEDVLWSSCHENPFGVAPSQ